MSLVAEFPQLSERRNQFLLISSIAFLVTAGATEDLSTRPAIEMKALKELVRTKPRLPGATKREKIVVPALESIEGYVGIVSGEPLPKILIKLKNSGKKLVNLSFNHISFSLHVKGYDERPE